jgi:hypothetical protein
MTGARQRFGVTSGGYVLGPIHVAHEDEVLALFSDDACLEQARGTHLKQQLMNPEDCRCGSDS